MIKILKIIKENTIFILSTLKALKASNIFCPSLTLFPWFASSSGSEKFTNSFKNPSSVSFSYLTANSRIYPLMYCILSFLLNIFLILSATFCSLCLSIFLLAHPHYFSCFLGSLPSTKGTLWKGSCRTLLLLFFDFNIFRQKLNYFSLIVKEKAYFLLNGIELTLKYHFLFWYHSAQR